jgi:hypothetical protein
MEKIMVYILDPEKLKQALKPMGVKSRGLYMSKAIQNILDGCNSYPWAQEKGSTKTRPKEYSWEFNEFWKNYPRKTGKANAWKSWWKAAENQEGELLRLCLLALDWQRECDQWVKDSGQFIPHASTWLNQVRWADEDPNHGLGMETYITSEGEEKTRARTC